MRWSFIFAALIASSALAIGAHAASARHGSVWARALGVAEVLLLPDGSVLGVAPATVELGADVGVALGVGADPKRVTSPQLERSTARTRNGAMRPTITGYP